MPNMKLSNLNDEDLAEFCSEISATFKDSIKDARIAIIQWEKSLEVMADPTLVDRMNKVQIRKA